MTERKEVINVTKNGITQKVKISVDQNEAKSNELKKILGKNKCMDIFKDIMVDHD